MRGQSLLVLSFTQGTPSMLRNCRNLARLQLASIYTDISVFVFVPIYVSISISISIISTSISMSLSLPLTRFI